MAGTFLQDIQSFDEKRRLKSVETVVTTPSGKRVIYSLLELLRFIMVVAVHRESRGYCKC